MKQLAILALVAGTCMISTSAKTVELVLNGSFENPAPDSFWNYSNPDGPYLTGSFTNWVSSGQSGVWQPGTGMFSSIGDGLQVGWTGNVAAAGTLTQTLSHTIAVGDSFVLAGEFGDRSNLLQGYGGVTTGTVSVYTSTNVFMMAANLSGTGTTGNWSNFSLNFPTGTFDAYAGQGMYIVLSSPVGAQTSYDKISVQAVPEPSTLTALGMFGLALLRKRKAK